MESSLAKGEANFMYKVWKKAVSFQRSAISRMREGEGLSRRRRGSKGITGEVRVLRRGKARRRVPAAWRNHLTRLNPGDCCEDNSDQNQRAKQEGHDFVGFAPNFESSVGVGLVVIDVSCQQSKTRDQQ